VTVRHFDNTVPASERGLVIAVWGEEKTGKNFFSYSFPEPIRVMNFDGRWQEARNNPDHAAKDIQAARFTDITPRFDAEDWGSVLDDFIDTWEATIADMDEGTVILDTATQVWQLVQNVMIDGEKQKQLRKLQKQKPNATLEDLKMNRLNFGPANQIMAGVLRLPTRKPRLNAVYLHRAHDVYVDNEKAGVARHGFGEVPDIVQATIKLTVRGGAQIGTIESSGTKWGLNGFELEEPSYDLLKEVLL
jgi:hypothetical protein